MKNKFISMRNIKFLLYDVHDIESLTGYDYFSEHDRETFDLALEEALKMGSRLIYPALEEMDKQPPVFINGMVKVSPVVRELMKRWGGGGWISATFHEKHGGHRMPGVVMSAFRYILSAANYPALAYPALTAGAAHLILSFGSEELINKYTPKMFSGNWQGTMALTEPAAGSSLSDVKTSATPHEDGYYNINGQKVFISAGDHDGVDNVVHLMLARVQGAPPGASGISLFVVPKMREEEGSLLDNDVSTIGIYHKLGYRGIPAAHLSMGDRGDCRGYLVGETGEGLKYMFQMMNEARIDVGLSAAGIGTAAYYAAVKYSLERLQGRRISNRGPEMPQIPIIEHADVKRMLLYQKAVLEGSVSLILNLSKYYDLARVTEGDEKERYELLLDLLTPVAKSYASETGINSVSMAMQCMGGYGYCDDFPLEQYYRDIRIHSIHEGTTGIQGLDLLGRKIVMKNGRAFEIFLHEIGETVESADGMEQLSSFRSELKGAVKILRDVTGNLTGLAAHGEVERYLGDSTLYLEFFGIIVIAWQWLLQGVAAVKELKKSPGDNASGFYRSKLAACRYFFSYELPNIYIYSDILKKAEGMFGKLDPAIFHE